MINYWSKKNEFFLATIAAMGPNRMLNRASIMVDHPIVTTAHETYRAPGLVLDLFKVDGIVFSFGFSSYPYESNMN